MDKDDHTDLFWFKEGGEGFLREIIRMNLLMMAVFVAYCVTIFVPNTLYGSHHDDVKESMQIFSIVMLVRDVVYFNHITFFMFQLRHSNLTIDILLSNIIREHSIDTYIFSLTFERAYYNGAIDRHVLEHRYFPRLCFST